nr:MAG TPA: hypothetical protein [Caudoviricetes sp.]
MQRTPTGASPKTTNHSDQGAFVLYPLAAQKSRRKP